MDFLPLLAFPYFLNQSSFLRTALRKSPTLPYSREAYRILPSANDPGSSDKKCSRQARKSPRSYMNVHGKSHLHMRKSAHMAAHEVIGGRNSQSPDLIVPPPGHSARTINMPKRYSTRNYSGGKPGCYGPLTRPGGPAIVSDHNADAGSSELILRNHNDINYSATTKQSLKNPAGPPPQSRKPLKGKMPPEVETFLRKEESAEDGPENARKYYRSACPNDPALPSRTPGRKEINNHFAPSRKAFHSSHQRAQHQHGTHANMHESHSANDGLIRSRAHNAVLTRIDRWLDHDWLARDVLLESPDFLSPEFHSGSSNSHPFFCDKIL